jgi:hypothetical protein
MGKRRNGINMNGWLVSGYLLVNHMMSHCLLLDQVSVVLCFHCCDGGPFMNTPNYTTIVDVERMSE